MRARERLCIAMSDHQRGRFEGVHAGEHIAFIYEETAELAAFVVPFIKEGLASRERCLYVVEDAERAEVIEALATGGVDVDRESRRGALLLINAEEHAGPPPFDPARLVESIRGRAAEARSGGFAGLRVAGQMTWTLTARIPDRALIEFELLLEKAAGADPLTVACMYRRDRFNPAVLRQMIRSHPLVVVKDSVSLSLDGMFQNLDRAIVQGLLQSAREHRVPKGGSYFHQGDPADEIYILMRGLVKLGRTDSDGRNVIFRIVKPMELFLGDPALLEDATRPASVSANALGDSRALAWNVQTILDTMRKHPAVSFNVFRASGERAEEYVSRLQDLATSSVEQRLARQLLRLAQSVGRQTVHGIAIEVSLSGQDLAELIFTTQYTVSRILADWRRLGVTDAQRDRILLLDPGRIAAVARMDVRGITLP